MPTASASPRARGEKQPERDFLYREFAGYGGQLFARMGNWKLIKTGLSGKKVRGKSGVLSVELYDLSKDEKETTNVAADHPDIVAKLETIITQQHTRSADFPIAALENKSASSGVYVPALTSHIFPCHLRGAP